MKRFFDAKFFAKNRQNLIKSLGHGSLVVMTAHGQMQRSADMAFRFAQEPNFWYLSGIDVPGWWIIIDGAQDRTWLVRPDADPIRTVFDGALSDQDALRMSGADNVIDQIEARRLLGSLRQRHRIAYTLRPQPVKLQYGFYPNPALKEFGDILSKFEMRDARKEIAALRAIKNDREIEAITSAVATTVNGIKRVLKELPSLKYEYEVEAILNYEFRVKGGGGHCFDPIAASGVNTCVMHYERNNDKFAQRSWLLMDVGAAYAHYSSDVARTVPTTKLRTARQLEVYAAVQRVNVLCIAYCQSGASVAEYQNYADGLIAHELVSLGLLKDPDDKEAVRKYFPHAIGHGLGISPHESLGGHKTFMPGMVMAIEPGIYIPEESFGVRIENDILITDEGPHNLSSALPTDLDALAKLSTS